MDDIKTQLQDLLRQLSTEEQYRFLVSNLLEIADACYLEISTSVRDVHQVTIADIDGNIEWEGFVN